MLFRRMNIMRNRQNPVILIAEDDADLLQLLTATLTDAALGFPVAACGTFGEAWSVIAGGGVALLIADLVLGGGERDGAALIRGLRASVLPPPPSILITGVDMTPETAEALGPTRFLQKPFRPLDLALISAELLDVTWAGPCRR